MDPTTHPRARYLCSTSAVCEAQKLFFGFGTREALLARHNGRRFKSHPTSSNSVKAAQGARCCRQRQSDTRSWLSSHVWIICHLSRPLDWKSSSGDRASCSSKKNFNVSLPLGPPASMDCV